MAMRSGQERGPLSNVKTGKVQNWDFGTLDRLTVVVFFRFGGENAKLESSGGVAVSISGS